MSSIRWVIERQNLELRHPFTISRGTSHSRVTVRLGLEKDGLLGWGEAAPNPRYGESPEETIAVLQRLSLTIPAGEPFAFRSFLESGRKILAESPAAQAALDSAVLDWAGKKLGLPVYRLLGVDPTAMKPTSYTLGIDAPETMASRAGEARAFSVLKVKLGTGRDRELVQAVRGASTTLLRVDANEGWKDPAKALQEIEWLASLGVELVEQPLPASMDSETAWLKSRSPLPLIADESVKSLVDLPTVAEAFHGINIKLAKCGGILAALDLIGSARAFGMTVMLGCMVESSCGLAAAAQIAPLADYVDLDSNLMVTNDPFTPLEVKSGVVQLNEAPGLGVRLRAPDSSAGDSGLR